MKRLVVPEAGGQVGLVGALTVRRPVEELGEVVGDELGDGAVVVLVDDPDATFGCFFEGELESKTMRPITMPMTTAIVPPRRSVRTRLACRSRSATLTWRISR